MLMVIERNIFTKFFMISILLTIIDYNIYYPETTSIIVIPKNAQPCVLVESVFGKERPGTVFFNYIENKINITKSILNNKRFNSNYVLNWKKTEHKDFVVTYSGRQSHRGILNEILEYNGLLKSDAEEETNSLFKLYNFEMTRSLVSQFNKYQKYNHVPQIAKVTSKDNMWRFYKNMRSRFPEDFNYMRDTFLIPEDWQEFKATYDSNKNKVWIMKPKALSRGRGVELIDSLEEIPDSALLTEYIANPYLIYNRKLDIRLYVVVTGVDPLRVYLYKEAYVSFAAEEFTLDKSQYKNKCIHLTQFEIGKHSSNFDASKNKMSTFELKDYLAEKGIDFDKIWANIKDAILKAVLANVDEALLETQYITRNKNNFYELYGVDMTFDANLKPWLFEFNLNPDLSSILPVDTKIKNMMLADMLTLIGLVPFSRSTNNKKNPELFHDWIHSKYLINEKYTSIQKRREFLMYCIDEFSRQGGFERLFPVKETVDYYYKFISNPGPFNKLIRDWLKNPREIENELNIKRVYGPEYDV